MENNFVVFVFPTQRSAGSTRFDGFGRRLQKAGGFPSVDIVTVALENLIYVIDEQKNAHVYDSVTGVDLGDAQYVYLKSWEAMPEEASALATYLYHRGVPFADHAALSMGVSKLVTMFKLWSEGIGVPFTVYARHPQAMAKAIQQWGDYMPGKFVFKDIFGAKGKMNFLVDAAAAVEHIYEYSDVNFIAQRFVPNDGDYRVGIYFDTPAFIILRKGSGESHLNNTSAGGTAVYVPTEEAQPRLKSIAKKAARAVNLQVSGVDLIQDRETKKWFVLEVNQGSQIVTGAFTEENMSAFNRTFRQALRHRKTRDRKQPLKTIGRRTLSRLPELHVRSIVAKIDTGAYSSTLHAENIRIEGEEKPELVFELTPTDKLSTVSGKSETYRTTDYFVQKVRSSNGHIQERYSIRTQISIDGIRFKGILTLSDRSEMGYPLLIGRKLLRSRFMVNVELDEHREAKWSY